MSMQKMSIYYEGILNVQEITASIGKWLDKPLIDFRLKYTTLLGKPQELVYPTQPKAVYVVLDELLKRCLIKESQFKDIRSKIEGLEQDLMQDPHYSFYSA